MKINKKITEAKWVDYNEEVKLLLKPTPLSIVFGNVSNIAMARFVYAVEDWQGIEDTEGNKFECNKDNKEFMFDYAIEITTFVSAYLDKLTAIQAEEIKN
jgi:hypothetical protein